MVDFIRFECPSCGKAIKAKARQAGKLVRCPGRACRQTILTPPLPLLLPVSESVPFRRSGFWLVGAAAGVVLVIWFAVGLGVWFLGRDKVVRDTTDPVTPEQVASKLVTSMPSVVEPVTKPSGTQSDKKGAELPAPSVATAPLDELAGVWEMPDLRLTIDKGGKGRCVWGITDPARGRYAVAFNELKAEVHDGKTFIALSLHAFGATKDFRWLARLSGDKTALDLEETRNQISPLTLKRVSGTANPATAKDSTKSLADFAGTWTGVLPRSISNRQQDLDLTIEFDKKGTGFPDFRNPSGDRVFITGAVQAQIIKKGNQFRAILLRDWAIELRADGAAMTWTTPEGGKITLTREQLGKAEPAPTSANDMPAGSSDAPVLSDLTVISATTSPVSIRFSVRIQPGKAPISFTKKSGLWFCIGQPTTIPSMRSYLEQRVQELRPSLEDANNVRFMGSMNGPGFVAGPCAAVQQSRAKPDVWSGSADSSLKVEGGMVSIRSSFGTESFDASAMPVSLIVWDENYNASNELKAVVDLKQGKLVKVIR